jgi:hypothetical protein
MIDVAETGWRAELGVRTTEILGKFGVAGRVEVEGQLVWLIGHGPTVEVALPELSTTSAAQTPVELNRLAERLARDLATARRHAVGKSDSDTGWLGWLKLVPALLVVLLGIWAATHYLMPHQSRTNSATYSAQSGVARSTSVTPDVAADKRERDYRACSQTVARIQLGGTVTPLDIEGWVVELSLISDRPNLDPSTPTLAAYFENRPNDIERSQQWSGAPILSQISSTLAGVLVSKDPLANAASVTGSGIRITWRGQYVASYFKEYERKEFTRLADSLYQATNARYGALYARCAQGIARYLGSWFRGPDVGGAVWSLIAEVELFADVPQIPNAKSGDGPEQWVVPLNRMAILAHSITRKQAAFILASTAGSVSERLGQSATLEFPFAQGYRANAASRKLVRMLTSSSAGAR